MNQEKSNLQKGKVIIRLLKIVGIIILLFVCFISWGVYWFFFSMDSLPTGELINEVTSPGGNYTVKGYRSDGGATTSYAIRGELVFNKQKRAPKNIYWNYREDQANIIWLDDDTVVINGHELNVPNDRFDFRRYR
ncbi:hypothetical protein GJ688_00015 [Heliobacillus mobilis]|uniref:DUF5412 domain-containing protein n=1 Tax=Heliobacterium mobile TaxID=28064 RepID=A0A6I3SAX9_HELMO|nr:DUF5412 domain-containing protein [Heliobacterium mobile]MTV47362.1 hypothetical protein [Heliobacterium mobile]